MLAQLAEVLRFAPITIRRLLVRIGYFRSFTHNGKWYTVTDVPDFSAEGLWHYRDIGFSQKGSLTNTIVHLVDRSPCGLSAADLNQKLQHPCHPVLTNLHKEEKLDRIKLGGEYRYLSVQPRLNRRQRSALELETEEPPGPPEALGTQAALFVLIEHVKSPGLDFEQIAARVSKERGLIVTAGSIRFFFEKEGLKKTPDPPGRRR